MAVKPPWSKLHSRTRRRGAVLLAIASIAIPAAVVPAASASANYCDGSPAASGSTYGKPWISGSTPAIKGRPLCDTTVTPNIHTGQDWDKNPPHFNLYSPNNGIVLERFTDDCMGKTLVLKFGDGNRAAYGHMSSVVPHVGDSITKGDFVGETGNTSCYGSGFPDHLHYSMFSTGWNGWASTHFYEPRGFLGSHGVTWVGSE
ncbi:M23 family metallopeptidase [Galbitalea sp. SE-J8]|uniref:M23 family metallopeptidase n=1 Tax=Galbitalea sp. SE-J8 TaxID=3054952 RepID=UPI00259D098F|nr:M23 family metallopeptidase [Galbitalea sp. SE-J8]MDM4764411.1 M23 family metallopeptidase [Galbitalea sp. SE-J8]